MTDDHANSKRSAVEKAILDFLNSTQECSKCREQMKAAILEKGSRIAEHKIPHTIVFQYQCACGNIHVMREITPSAQA